MRLVATSLVGICNIVVLIVEICVHFRFFRVIQICRVVRDLESFVLLRETREIKKNINYIENNPDSFCLTGNEFCSLSLKALHFL